MGIICFLIDRTVANVYEDLDADTKNVPTVTPKSDEGVSRRCPSWLKITIIIGAVFIVAVTLATVIGLLLSKEGM